MILVIFFTTTLINLTRKIVLSKQTASRFN